MNKIKLLYLRCKLFFSMLTAQEAEELMLMMRSILDNKRAKRAYKFHIKKCRDEIKTNIMDGSPLFLYTYDRFHYVKPKDLAERFKKEFPGYFFTPDDYGILVKWSNIYR